MLKVQNSKKIPKKIPKKDPCKGCGALCCHDLAMHIYRPRTKPDIEELRWQLRFDTVRVFIRNKRWFMLTEGRCMYLDKNDLCTIYEDRPKTCRNHPISQCERYCEGYYWDTLIETPEQLDKYLKKKKNRPSHKLRTTGK